MLLQEKKIKDDVEICFFYSNSDAMKLPNIIKTIFHNKEKHLQIFYVKTFDKDFYFKKNVSILKRQEDWEKEIRRDSPHILIEYPNKKFKIITSKVYYIYDVDLKLYSSFKKADSQGNFYNAKLYDDVKKRAMFSLSDQETSDLIFEWTTIPIP